MSIEQSIDLALVRAMKPLRPRYVAIRSSFGRRVVAGVAKTNTEAWGLIDQGRSPASCLWALAGDRWVCLRANGLGHEERK